MTFDETLTQVLDLLRRDSRVSYRALRRRFELDDKYLEDLKAEIIKAKQLAVDEDGEVLVWTGGGPETFDRDRSPMRYNREGAEESYKVGAPEIINAEINLAEINLAEINLGDNSLLLGDMEQTQHYLE